MTENRSVRLFAFATILAASLAIRVAWPLADPSSRLSWSNGVYTDPATMVHAARNAALTGDWMPDYNRDYPVYPLMNWLTYLAYQPGGPGRLPTVWISAIAGTILVGALMWGVGRVAGVRAALFAGLLAGASHWLAMFARIPIAENVVAALLALSAAAALGRSKRALAVAGALGVGATLFGKYHAVGFLPGLFLFVLLRHRSWRPVLALVGGGALVFAAWIVVVWIPHGEHVLAHVRRQSTEFHGDLPFVVSVMGGLGEFLNAVRRSWMFFRIPICGLVGSLFAIWVLGNGWARRRRLEDGAAIFALWFLCEWIYFGLLPYKAPRYFMLVAPALIACTAIALDDLVRRNGFTWRPPMGWDEYVPLVVALFFGAFVFVDMSKHWASISLDYLSLPPARVTEETVDLVVAFFKNFDTFQQGLVAAAVLAGLGFVGVMWNPEIVRRILPNSTGASAGAMRGLAYSLLGLSVGFGLWQFGWWASHRSYYLEEVKGSFNAMIAPDAVVLGPLAPLLTQDSDVRCLPYFGPARFEDTEKGGLFPTYEITHFVVMGGGDADVIRERFPGVLAASVIVHSWPVRTLFASTLELRRVGEELDGSLIHSYEPTAYERGVEHVEKGRFREALAEFEAFRENSGAALPELLSLESVCWSKIEDYDRAGELLKEAIRLRPKDPLNHQNLGVLRLREGDRARAVEAFMTAYRLDPTNPELERILEELTR